MNDDLRALLDRIAAGVHTDADLAALRRALPTSDQDSVVQIGKYNVVIHNGQDIRIGDTIYQLPPPEPEIDLVAAEARYREQVVATYNRLGFSGFPEADLMLTEVPLEKVFVRLSLTVEKVERVRDGDERAQSGDLSKTVRRGKEVKEHRERERIIRIQEPVTLAAALSKNVLIVGEPGAGKSTLLRWLAVTYAQSRRQEAERLDLEAEGDRLPVYVELGRLPDAYLRGEGGETLNWKELLPELIAKHQAFDADAGPVLAEALADGRCLVLCDGLDEVADRAARARIAESLVEFGSLSKGNRVAIGSRPAGIADTESALRPGFQRCQIERFTPDEVQRFFRFWYGLDVSLTPDRQMAEADPLYSRVQANPGVAKLAATPLLATILLLIWRNEGDLPGRRVEVYERCCKILVENWERHHEVGHGGVLATLGWEAHLRLLAPVAYAIHSREQRTNASRDELVPVLAKSLFKEGLCSSEQNARREAEGFLAGLGLRSGLLQRLGPEEYGFPHLTFQEYLAARYIGEQPYPDYIDLFMTHLHEAWWREVHLLAIGHLGSDVAGGKKGSRLILEILNRYPPPGPLLCPSPHRWLRLVQPGRWLSRLQWQRRLAWLLGRELELAAVGRAEMIPDTITEEAASRLDRLAGRFMWQNLRDEALMGTLNDLVPVLGQASPEMAATLMRALGKRDASIRKRAATNLGQLGQGAPDVVRALIASLDDDGFDVAKAAAESLGHLGQDSPEVLAALIGILDDLHPFGRMWVAFSLSPLGQASIEARTALIRALSDEAFGFWLWAATVRDQLGPATTDLMAALIRILDNSDPDDDDDISGVDPVRRAAASSLGRLGQPSPHVVATLIRALRDRNADVRWGAASGLGLLGHGSPDVLDALFCALGDSDQDVREEATSSLGLLGKVSADVVAALISALGAHDSTIRQGAASSLGLLDQATPEVLVALINALSDDHSAIRQRAASSLGLLDQATPEVLLALISALGDHDSIVQREAASSLGQLGQASTEVVTALIRALHYRDVDVRREAAFSLCQLGQASPEVVTALICILRDSDAPSGLAHWRAREGLALLGQESSAGVTAIINAMGDAAAAVRQAASSALGELDEARPDVVKALVSALSDRDSAVREAAVASLGRLSQASPDMMAGLIGALRDRRGAVRNAAAESLGLIGKLDELQLRRVLWWLNRRVHDVDMRGDSRSTAFEAARRLLAGRPMPGQPWVPIREREKRRRKGLAAAFVVAAMAIILLVAALWMLAQGYLGTGSRTVAFAAAVAGVAALLGAAAEVLRYLRGRNCIGT